eukprot:TRINITY_DN67889_c1_g2_i1.p1 TRINITY_DN67889_c1_g2~~TRINITY_DN67889_c1_g2_i1.p1  ORF type:complete len:520 (+),score=20.96 TRINITY_DN67889_c1_g2_i1:33-1592(+)
MWSSIKDYVQKLCSFFGECTRPEFMRECRVLLKFCAPIVFQVMLLMGCSISSIFFTGYFLPQDQAAIAAIGMGFLLVNALGQAIAVGLLGGFTTLGAQAYGAKNYERVTHLFQRVLAMEAIALVFIIIAWTNVNKLMYAAGQPPELTALTYKFVLARIPGIPCYAFMNAVLRWLQIQGIVKPTLWYGLSYLGLVIVLLPIYYSFGWGFIACPIAITTAEVVTSVSLFFIVVFWLKMGRDSFTGWTPKALKHGWKELLRYTIPAGLGLWFEWCGTEVQVFLAGMLGTDQSAVMTATLQLVLFFFSMPLGLGMGASNKIGYYLGANEPLTAKTATTATIVMGLVPMLIGGIIILVGQPIWVPITLKTLAAQQMEKQVIPLVFVFCLVYGLAITALCALRGMGKVGFGFIAMFVGQYVVSLPMSVGLAFGAGIGVVGLWTGMNCGMLTSVLLQLGSVSQTDWPKLATKVAVLAKSSSTEDLMEICEETPLLHHKPEHTNSMVKDVQSSPQSTSSLIADSGID